MQMRVPVWCFLIFSLAAVSFVKPVTQRVNTIKGVVLSESTGKPVSAALVYVVLGEEEALTKAAGAFSIETSHGYPIEVLTEHRDYLKQSVILKGPTDKLVVRLKPRQN